MSDENSISDPGFEIGAEGVDVEQVVAAIRETVRTKARQGVYTDPVVARAERSNLAHLRDDEHLMEIYLECLRDAVFVDISDFSITERRRPLGSLWVGLKTLIWKMLKFYTYRLWSQQNQVNGLLLSAVEGLDEKYRDRISRLETRVAELEGRGGESR